MVQDPRGPNSMPLLDLLPNPSHLITLKMTGAVDWSSKILTPLAHFPLHYPWWLSKAQLLIPDPPNFSTRLGSACCSDYSTFVMALFLNL
ncbi:hypothetical protein M413DRAFT_121225 [Hebeloma cylindrosporum]|uniref:Uncharacterized protein n=1 Tax=Hebeloma cylindrosporum TaxID=76867 RepID=A0A0C2XYF8_HEBCY|nr:hypothetical protein M413DRAFT_121225 [Hebeloma cylindrosporum h7]